MDEDRPRALIQQHEIGFTQKDSTSTQNVKKQEKDDEKSLQRFVKK
jgi:hypothetical protein